MKCHARFKKQTTGDIAQSGYHLDTTFLSLNQVGGFCDFVFRSLVKSFVHLGRKAVNSALKAIKNKFRAECVGAHWFLSLVDASEGLEKCRRHCNEDRPYRAIRNNPPTMLAISIGDTIPTEPSKPEDSSPKRHKDG